MPTCPRCRWERIPGSPSGKTGSASASASSPNHLIGRVSSDWCSGWSRWGSTPTGATTTPPPMPTAGPPWPHWLSPQSVSGWAPWSTASTTAPLPAGAAGCRRRSRVPWAPRARSRHWAPGGGVRGHGSAVPSNAHPATGAGGDLRDSAGIMVWRAIQLPRREFLRGDSGTLGPLPAPGAGAIRALPAGRRRREDDAAPGGAVRRCRQHGRSPGHRPGRFRRRHRPQVHHS